MVTLCGICISDHFLASLTIAFLIQLPATHATETKPRHRLRQDEVMKKIVLLDVIYSPVMRIGGEFQVHVYSGGTVESVSSGNVAVGWTARSYCMEHCNTVLFLTDVTAIRRR